MTTHEEGAAARADSAEPSEPTTLTTSERESLIDTIVNEIRKDSLKHDVSLKLTKRNWLNSISSFFQHPAVLVFIGFIITGLIGGWIANRWQRQEWNRQQLRLIDIRGADLKYELSNEMTKSIGERNAAAMGILAPLDEEKLSDKQLVSEEADRIKIWNAASNEWRTNSQVLRGKIDARVKSQDIARMFEQILDKERKIGAKVNIVKLDLVHYHRPDDNRVQQYLGEIHTLIEQTTQDLKPLVKAIAMEADTDIDRR